MIDLVRLIIAYFPHIFRDDGARQQVLNALLAACDWSAGFEGELEKNRSSSIAITFRAISNAFQSGSPAGDFHYVLEVRKPP